MTSDDRVIGDHGWPARHMVGAHVHIIDGGHEQHTCFYDDGHANGNWLVVPGLYNRLKVQHGEA